MKSFAYPAIAAALWLASTPAAWPQPYQFTTLAGQPGYRNVDGTNAGAIFSLPCGIARDSSGNLYVVDYFTSTIRMATPVGANWAVTTIAGSPGLLGSADGTNSNARFENPQGIAVDNSGNLYVTDTGNGTIRKITPMGTNWVVTTYAGKASNLPGGAQDGVGPMASFFIPQGIAVDKAGNLYVADTANETIRMITPDLNYGNVKTIAGLAPTRGGGSGTNDGVGGSARFNSPAGVAVDNATNIYIADGGNNTIRKIAFTNSAFVTTTIAGLATVSGSVDGTNSGSRFNNPSGMGLDGATYVYVTDAGNFTIRRVSPVGTNWVTSTLAGEAGFPGSVDGTNGVAQFREALGIALDAATNLYVADTWNGTLREVSPSGTNWSVGTIVGDPGVRSTDGTNTGARFWVPKGVALDSFGNMYVADCFNGSIRMLELEGGNWVSSTIAGFPDVFGSVDGTNDTAQFNEPYGIAATEAGDLFLVDERNSIIRQVSPIGTNWVTTTIAGLAGSFGSADGTNTSARFRDPSGVAADSAGNIYVADSLNFTVRELSESGANWVVTTIAGAAGNPGSADGTNAAARFYNPTGIAADGAGNLYVTDATAATIRMMTPIGTNWVVRTIAGLALNRGSADGANSAARFNSPSLIAVDTAGNLFVADTGNLTIRKVTPVGTNWVVTTVAGLAGSMGTNDGTGTACRFVGPYGIAVDAADNLYVTDEGADTIRFGQPVWQLQASLTGNQLIVTWPALAADNYFLQTSSSPGADAVWTAVTNGVTVSGSNLVLTNDLAAPAAFYRLRHL